MIDSREEAAMRADLHLHSWISDGEVAPSEVVKLAIAAKLGVISLTDHDTAAGVPEALATAADLPVTVIPGIEISTRLDEDELHILGYWIDATSEPILEHQRRAVERRNTRMAAMVEKLQQLGVRITYEDVEAAAGPSVRSLGRPHLARALFNLKHTRFYNEAFVRYIGDDGPAFVAEGFPTPMYAIDVIHAAGGVAVWAHPAPSLLERVLPILVRAGIDGIECYRPGLLASDLSAIESAARRFNLFPTGGSDWHGPGRSTLGEFAVDTERIRRLLEIGGVDVSS